MNIKDTLQLLDKIYAELRRQGESKEGIAVAMAIVDKHMENLIEAQRIAQKGWDE